MNPYLKTNLRDMPIVLTAFLLSSPLRAETVLITDFENTAEPVYTYSGTNSYVNAHYINFLVYEGSYAMQVDNDVRNYTGSLIPLSGDAADWSEAETLSMWVHANSNDIGKTFDIVVEDTAQEQFTATVMVNQQGWFQVNIPVGSFVSRTDWQPLGAVVNGLIDSPIMTLHFMTLGYTTHLTLFFDLIELTVTDDVVGETERVSVDSAEVEGNDLSAFSDFSADGRYVSFQSLADNLVPNDTNGTSDIFVRDRLTGDTTRVSTASDGTQANSFCSFSKISADGRFVAFDSVADNLVPNDTNNRYDTFIHDRDTGETRRVLDGVGIEADESTMLLSISADGKFVGFQSYSDNLVPNDTNGTADVFVYDLVNDILTRVSVDSDGVQGNGLSRGGWISADGRYVSFHSQADNLVLNDTNGWVQDVFVHDMLTGETKLISVNNAGVQGNDDSSGRSISRDGRYIAYSSEADNLITGDTNGFEDIFVYDALLQTVTRVSVDSTGAQAFGRSWKPSISGDGQKVIFESYATNLVSDDTNGVGDVFLHDMTTGLTSRVSLAYDDTEANDRNEDPIISDDGNYVVFQSEADNLVLDDTNGASDIFVRHLDAQSVPSTALNLGPLNTRTTFTVNGSQDLEIDSLVFSGWTPQKIVVGFGSSDGLSLNGVSVSINGGAPIALTGDWQEIMIDFTGQSAIYLTVTSTTPRTLQTQWWAQP